jgi:hypothetical protein
MAEKESFSYRRLNNHEWLRQSFMIPHTTRFDSRGTPAQSEASLRSRFFTSAALKYSDTSLGGNMVVNPIPQFTRQADPRVKGLYFPSDGMGRFYSEAFDDNKRYITMSFGNAQFNSLTTFYKGMYSNDMASVARSGRAPSVFFQAGNAIGFVVGHLTPWLVAYSVGSAFFNWVMNAPSTKYYFFKVAMPSYWSAVATIANDIAVKTQLISRAISAPVGTEGFTREALTNEDLMAIHAGMEDLVDSYDEEKQTSNGINVYAVATKYQRIQRRAYAALEKRYATGDTPWSLGESIVDETDSMLNTVRAAISGAARPKVSFNKYLSNWTTDGPGVYGKASLPAVRISLSDDGTATQLSPDGVAAEGSMTETSDIISEVAITEPSEQGFISKWMEFLKAELDDGAQYVTFRVENTGDAQESFSNQAGESEISTKINSISGSARSTRFSVADGNVGDGIFGTIAGGIATGVKDLAAGVANGIGFGGLSVLGGNAFVDIPKHWMNSSTNMPSMSYTIRLFSPYGNRYSKFVNIWLPLSMLIAGALPLSTGAHTYTSPFLCQLFDRGRAQTRLGMIDSMSITRGKSNLAFNRIGEPSAIEVTFSIVELSNIVHMPISHGFGLKDAVAIFDQESLYNDYISVLSSMSLAEQIYVAERLKLGLTRFLKRSDSHFSAANSANWFGDLSGVRIFTMFFDGIANR